jgi:hypothetical protein
MRHRKVTGKALRDAQSALSSAFEAVIRAAGNHAEAHNDLDVMSDRHRDAQSAYLALRCRYTQQQTEARLAPANVATQPKPKAAAKR